MTSLSEFSYPDITQRKIILLNSLISFIIFGFIYINASIVLNYYFIYQPVLKIVFICAVIGLFAGNLAGLLIFTKIKNHRKIYVISDVLFILSSLLYIYGKLILPGNNNPLLYLFFKSQYLTIVPLLIISFFAGIKINYFLKISCGNFIDNKKAVTAFLLTILAGIALGIVVSAVLHYFQELYYYSGILILLLIPTIFIVKLSYNPAPIFAQEITGDIQKSSEEKESHKREDLFFIYLNFTYVIIYLFLGFTSVIKYHRDFLHIKIILIFLTFLSLILGFISGKTIRKAFWYIYLEMLYPLIFLLSLAFLVYFKDTVSFFPAVFVFVPASIILGFSLYQNINHILLTNNHKDTFSVIDFSIFILPAPILISLNFIDFTNFWFFALLYVTAILNIFIPGIYLMQSAVAGYKKLLFFIFTLIFIPLVIVMHLYFNIPMSSSYYITHTKGFENINNINFNSPFINNEATISLKDVKAFYADNPSFRNMKRSIAAVLLYSNSNKDDSGKMLFIDGNYKFFKNSIITLFKNTYWVDYVPDRIVDFKSRSVPGDTNLSLYHCEILKYLNNSKSAYKIITDIPNLFDQSSNAFRFSKEYYNIIKKFLTNDGIFVQILSTNCRSDFLSNAAGSLKVSFKKTIGYYFPDNIIFLSSNNDDALKLDINNINNFKVLYDTKTELKNIFYNEFQLLSHILFLDIDDFLVYLDKKDIHPFYFIQSSGTFNIDKNLVAGYFENNSSFTELIDKNSSNIGFRSMMQNQLALNKFYLTELKKAEMHEINKDYENEAAIIMTLKRHADYRADLRKYISDILSYKEDYYYNAALAFERDKNWEEARKLYRAILTINKNNFEANYRLGILSIVLQDLNSSFVYLQYAMNLKRDDPKVFYQMGVLLFASGRPKEALTYLEKALELKERTASVYYYMGLSYEELGYLSNAGNNYNQAAILDPNDKNIISAIERIKEKNNSIRNGLRAGNDKKSDTEAEQGEDMPLPINETAINVRLKEDKSRLLQLNEEDKNKN